MQIYVLTCDKYAHLMSGFAYCFNKYWGAEQPVNVLYFKTLPPLPSNFKPCQIAPVEELLWADHVRAYFKSIAVDEFVLLLDDYWLIEPVDLAKVVKLEQEVVAGRAAKADLSINTFQAGYTCDGEYIVATPTAGYRNSLQAAIWTRKYLLSFLDVGANIWHCEMAGSRKAMCDGARIIALNSPRATIQYINVYHRGKPNTYQLARISSESVDALHNIGALKFP